MHLNEAFLKIKGGMNISERESMIAGTNYTLPCFSPVGYLGLSISYDLRFPELYRRLTLGGA